MTDLATLHLTLPPGLSERIRAHAAQWGCAPEAAAIYCLMARFPAPSIIEATTELAGAFPSRSAHKPFERAADQRPGEAEAPAGDLA